MDPNLGDPADDSPVLEDREVKKRRRKKDALDVAQELDGEVSLPEPPTPVVPDPIPADAVKPGLEPPAHAQLPQRVEQLALSGAITYSLPQSDALKPGSVHKAKSKAYDAVVDRLNQVLDTYVIAVH